MAIQSGLDKLYAELPPKINVLVTGIKTASDLDKSSNMVAAQENVVKDAFIQLTAPLIPFLVQ